MPTRPTLSALASALALALTAVACRPPPHPPLPCPMRARAGGSALEAATSTPWTVWFDLLAPDHAKAADPWAEVHECSGRPLDGGPAPDSKILPHRPPGAAALSFAAAPGGDLVVWARVVRYDDGDALGPIAQIRRHDDHLEVAAIGSLRAPAEAVTLRVEAPERGAPLVIAEGDRCPRPDACVREAQLLPRLGHRFVPIGIAAGEGPPRAARIPLEAVTTTTLADGWVREVETSRRLTVGGEGLAIHEITRIRECPQGLSQACEEQRGVDREDRLEIEDESFVIVEGR
ncbi:MAG: hypothetical protein R3B09_25655 [Nannocystaceae bacterium]